MPISKTLNGRTIVLALLLLSGFCGLSYGATKQEACAILSDPAATSDETAWRLFVALNCTTSEGKLAWEDWIEQDAFYPTDDKSARPSALTGARRLHGSGLAAVARAAQIRSGKLRPPLIASANQGCRGIKKFKDQLPDNVKEGGTICEETRLNPAIASFILE